MHRPPSVEFALGDARCLRRLVVVAWMTVLVADLGWSITGGARGGSWLAGLSLTGLAAMLAWRRSSILHGGILQWDGGLWTWEDAGGRHGCQARIALDLQSALLVQCRGESGAVHWCLPTAGRNPDQWLALRRALLATAAGGDAGGHPGESGPEPGARS